MATEEALVKLNAVAKQMVAPGKGILAADESTGTIAKRFATVNVPATEDTRRAYRQMLFTAPGMEAYISGVIMYDETIRQKADDGTLLPDTLAAKGVLPGIKVDTGTEAMREGSEEKWTKGLEGLPERLTEYAGLGAKFAKWRAVITIGEGIPTDACIEKNAHDLAEYARMCQEAGLVPIVEPEVLMDGRHSMEACRDASERTLVAVFNALEKGGVATEGIILKTNMVISGKESGKKDTSEEVARATVALFKKILPDSLVGEAFLSGGQSEVQATENLNAMYEVGETHPWRLAFSYGRALQGSALEMWAGKSENIPSAQKIFLHRAKMNSLATLGKYRAEAEQGR